MAEKMSTTIRINEFIRGKLREQAQELGMDVSNYIAYLVMYKEQKDRYESEARELTNRLIDAVLSANTQRN